MNFEATADEILQVLETLSRNSPLKQIGELPKGEIFLLGYLHTYNGSARSNELSEALGTSTARIAAAVKSMERKGWVYRKADEQDHRKTIVHLTPGGEAHLLEYRKHVRNALKHLLEELGEQDTREYLRIAHRMDEIVAKMHSDS